MTDPYRILIAYDYSNSADLALQRAFDLAANEERAEVHVVNVVLLPDGAVAGAEPVPGVGLGGVSGETRKGLEERLAERSAAWQTTSGKTFSRLVTHVRFQYPAREIAQLATDLEADLIVVGTHGRRGFNHFLMGSVAEGVVRLAHCQVLVVRPKQIPAEVPVILPPCPRCLETRQETQGAELWCEQHSERHGQRHTYHYESRAEARINPPLVMNQSRA